MSDTCLTPDDIETLTKLEESLWRAESRYDPVLMDQIFADDFLSSADPAVSIRVKT